MQPAEFGDRKGQSRALLPRFVLCLFLWKCLECFTLRSLSEVADRLREE